jgi:hypothetical protein
MAAGSKQERRRDASNEVAVAEPDRQALLTALTTEHFTLQGSRASTISESGSRAALYISAVSSALIALGFIGQASELGTAFDVFALTVLPTLFALGVFTFVRVSESSVEDVFYGRAINRIRHYYLELAGDERRYFMLSAHDDPLGVLANMGLRPSGSQLFFAASSMIAVINSVVGGTAVALAIGLVAGASLGVATACGAAFAVVSAVLHFRDDRRRHVAAGGRLDALFPSPPVTQAPTESR